MREALKEAHKAIEKEEVPIGSIIVAQNRIIARGHNLTETLNDVTAHAEMQAITSASSYLGGKYLKNCTIYITLEPCLMCAGALRWAQISRIVFGAYDTKYGFTQQTQVVHPKTEVLGGVMKDDCSDLLTYFFQQKRKK